MDVGSVTAVLEKHKLLNAMYNSQQRKHIFHTMFYAWGWTNPVTFNSVKENFRFVLPLPKNILPLLLP